MLVLLLMAGMTKSLAQNQVAILQHNDTLSAFYGPNALANAHEAAIVGDTITLSSGNFNGCDLTKAVTIHGAGCVEDTVAGFAPTRISSNVVIAVSNDTIPLTIEGVFFDNTTYYHHCNNVTLIKCSFNYLGGYWSDRNLNNLHMENCIVKTMHYKGSSAIIVNSVGRLYYYNQSDQNNINTIYNSVFVCNNNIHLNNSTITNSIIATSEDNSVSNTVFHNCIGIQTVDSSLFVGQLNNSNMTVDSYEDVFETFAGEVTYNNSYQLKDEIATTFLGNDGTEVGIYGGMRPYHPWPPYMIINSINVAGRTTDDNKLNVEIELNTGN